MSTGHPIGQSPSLTQERGFLFLLALVFLYRFGRDGGRGLGLRGVVLLNVSGGSGDSPPCLATTDADEYGTKDKQAYPNPP